MKVQVKLNVKPCADMNTAFDMHVNAVDTVAMVKERVATTQLIPFSDHAILLDGEQLDNSHRLSDCGVQDGSTLEFTLAAMETTLVQQLRALLQARPLSVDELSLLYCYKYGVSTSRALEFLGIEADLKEYLSSHKGFEVENGRASIA
mmetsp:Transcript_67292/g.161321  ORF Transcript_67292/g.161321 Transcript_67292/m.161321 type:complete len:148 (-) Transcript_67292:238-681(-)|eukprot:CAMPEP_0178422802 /NCGR_PEP_ID=MMETSP0689_2-20121128/27363_1 /TAXON_ID=160604 /ORGANISM="Amphidinium massartii, Strain CS-259" /LENGTH=147 /DNA_ID=CAMNT_0020044381 /DNA_START=155 /DNA_END=598 /DNA_ORIENTATION=-